MLYPVQVDVVSKAKLSVATRSFFVCVSEGFCGEHSRARYPILFVCYMMGGIVGRVANNWRLG